MKMSSLVASTFLCFLVTTIILGADHFPQNKEKATIIIFRQSDITGARYAIRMNDVPVVQDFRKNSYFSIEVPPGKLIIETSGNITVEKKLFSLQVNPGATYYLEAEVFFDFLTSTLYLLPRSEDQAQKHLSKLKLHGSAKKELD